MKTYLLIGIGGAGGAAARYMVNWAVNKWWTSAFPLATLLVNCLGCFLLAYLSKKLTGKINESLQKALTAGMIGSFTTFSAFSVETVQLLQANQWFFAFFYMLISIIAGLFFIYIGSQKGDSSR